MPEFHLQDILISFVWAEEWRIYITSDDSNVQPKLGTVRLESRRMEWPKEFQEEH